MLFLNIGVLYKYYLCVQGNETYGSLGFIILFYLASENFSNNNVFLVFKICFLVSLSVNVVLSEMFGW